MFLIVHTPVLDFNLDFGCCFPVGMRRQSATIRFAEYWKKKKKKMFYLRYVRLFAHNGVQHILCCVFWFVCLRLVSCGSNVASFPGLPIFDCLLGFSNIYFPERVAKSVYLNAEIPHLYHQNEVKTFVSERVIKPLKTKIYRHFTMY